MRWRSMRIRYIITHKELLLERRTVARYLVVLNMNEITTAIVVIVLKWIMIGLLLVRSW